MLSQLGGNYFETAVSVPLVLEYEDVLARESIGVSSSAATDVIDYICSVSHRQDIHFLWRPFLNNPKDDLLLELAVASQSAKIVTYNLKDFEGCGRFGVYAIRPAAFLAEIGVEP